MASWLTTAARKTWALPILSFVVGKTKIVVHTTETTGLPGYAGGTTAPHFTAKYNPKTKSMDRWQHEPLNEASRSLRNKLGGVETNRARAIQIELIGTCDKNGPSHRNGAFLWPEANDDALRALGRFLREVAAAAGVKPQAVGRWVAYPKSYANGGGQRMSFATWLSFNGICGHQHVPENSHGDPGNTNIPRALALSAPSAPLVTYHYITHELREGSTGREVKLVQMRLNVFIAKYGKKINNGVLLKADGAFGPKTSKAVYSFKAFLKFKGLSKNSIVGKGTVKALGGRLRWAGK